MLLCPAAFCEVANIACCIFAIGKQELMKKIAIPISNGRLSKHFGSCSHYRIFGVETSGISRANLEAPSYEDLTRLPAWVADQQITDIIAYKIDKVIIDLFARHKINVWVGAPDLDPEILLGEYLDGTLTSNEKVLNNDYDDN